MFKKISPKLFAVIGILAAVIIIDLIVKRPFFGTAKERVYELLHHGRVSVKTDSVDINSRDFLKKYYDVFGYTKNWTDSSGTNDKYRDMLIDMLKHADSLGLDRKDYHQDYISRFDSLSHLPKFDYAQYESENELIFADAALTFLYHVAYGKEINIGYNGVKYNIDSARIVTMFDSLLIKHNWRGILDSLEPKTTQYVILKSQLNRMQSFMQDSAWTDSITATNTPAVKQALVMKLKAYGLMPDSVNNDSVSASLLRTAIKGFQRMMGTDTTGVANDKTLAYLNFPLKKRIEQIKESLNYWRWTGRLKEHDFILVNIPAARLQIVSSDSTKDIGMRVIVGKLATRTPSFTAYITKVISYPYWTVPFSIATKEMLPKIRRDTGYLDNNSLQVINGKGEEVDPHKINWNKYSEKYFPYTLRQGTGCDNSLGVLKFDLNSPYSIYLHDTNRKDLFSNKNRFMSHGCVRVEKPMVLAEFLLREGLDTSTIAQLNKCMAEQKPNEFKLKKHFPVLIFYMTADVDEKGTLKFYGDVYGVEENTTETKKAI